MGLYEKLAELEENGLYPMHMPGHKRNKTLNMVNPYAIDITEIDGFDNLHEAEGLIYDIMERFNRLYGADATYLLINGSTAGILAGMSAAASCGGQVLVARNSHKAVYNAAYLRDFKVSYIYPEFDSDAGIATAISVQEVKRALRKNPEIRLVVITSPTYEGVISDIEPIAEEVHAAGAILMVDAAHGAHLGFGDNIKNMTACGADIVVHSIHKTLPAFTQTALIHLCGNRVSRERLERFLAIYQTSSPSYILMSGMDGCAEFLENGAEDFRRYYALLEEFYKHMSGLKNLKLWVPDKENAYEFDRSKLVILAGSGRGSELYDILRDKYRIQPEMVSKDYVLCMSSVCDTAEGFKRLAEALTELDKVWNAGALCKGCSKGIPGAEIKNTYKEAPGAGGKIAYEEVLGMERKNTDKVTLRKENTDVYKNMQHSVGMSTYKETRYNRNSGAYMECLYSKRADVCMKVREAEEAEWENISLESVAGRISAVYVYMYPPGIPLIVPGERIDGEMISMLEDVERAGIKIRGLDNECIKCIKV